MKLTRLDRMIRAFFQFIIKKIHIGYREIWTKKFANSVLRNSHIFSNKQRTDQINVLYVVFTIPPWDFRRHGCYIRTKVTYTASRVESWNGNVWSQEKYYRFGIRLWTDGRMIWILAFRKNHLMWIIFIDMIGKSFNYKRWWLRKRGCIQEDGKRDK